MRLGHSGTAALIIAVHVDAACLHYNVVTFKSLIVNACLESQHGRKCVVMGNLILAVGGGNVKKGLDV